MRTIFVSLFTVLCLAAYSQNKPINYLIKDVGYISIPPTMEIQSGDYKKFIDEFQDEFGKKFGYEVSGERIVFQQKGLNNLEKGAFESYARVMISTDIGNKGDFEKLSTKLHFTTKELTEYSNLLRTQMETVFAVPGLKLIRWYGTEIVTINGKSSIKTSYLRQLNDRPYVMVSLYQFFNNDRMHNLTVSYRLQDLDLWKISFEAIVNSFQITNIR